MPYTITAVTLGQLLGSEDVTIKRNAMSILKIMQKCDHKYEYNNYDFCVYCFAPHGVPETPKELKCFWCNKRKATIKDYREIDGTTGSYPSCAVCINLPTEDVLKMSERR